MRPLPGALPQVFDPRALDGGRPLRLDRAAFTSRAQTIVVLAVVPMVAVTLWLALTSDYLQRPAAAGIYWGYLVAAPLLIGLYWWIRRSASRFGPLLVAFGALVWIVSWQGAGSPLAYLSAAEGPS